MPRRAHVGMWVATTVTQQINVTSENTKDVCVCVRACVHACVRVHVHVRWVEARGQRWVFLCRLGWP